MQEAIKKLQQQFDGQLFFDDSALHQGHIKAYATDASVFEERPLAVAIPKTERDLVKLIDFATKQHTTLIPRAAGTSLAGQVVGNGIVVDISKHFTKIIELNVAERWVRVQPGVIRDDLNKFLQPHGLLFGPETSTASRAMMGGMLGNNSCGLHSIVWGSVRDHLLEATVLLSDGSVVTVNAQTSNPATITNNACFNNIKQRMYELLLNPGHQQLIAERFPKKTVTRRNTGYALDALCQQQPFHAEGKPFNLCSLLTGSEGTLALVTEMKLNLLPLPPKFAALVCVHCRSINEALLANAVAIRQQPMASELVDKCIMDYTIGHPAYQHNRFFIQGDPEAILMVEFMAHTAADATLLANILIEALKQSGNGYAYPVLYDAEAIAAWDIRKAGLGLLRNAAGNVQPVNLIEDCAVAPEDLPGYIADLQLLLKKYNVQASYYAHAGAGELHVEPMIDLKTSQGLFVFRNLLKETAQLVKKYNGSLSGEHGDGRLRGEFIATVMGNEVMELFKSVKSIFDPANIFNAGKIVNAPAMDTQLRVRQDEATTAIKTHFSFDDAGGILKLAEKCSGSGDCRRSAVSTGLMCPSYMATRNEFDTTRARANLLRQFLGNPADATPFDHKEIKAVMDLCLSCKGCKVECPSGVDITKMKAEFLQQYQQQHGVPFRSKLIGHFAANMRLAAKFSGIYNALYTTPFIARLLNRLVGFHPGRSMPLLAHETLRQWFGKRKAATNTPNGKVYLFCDEFTNYLDVAIGKDTINLLERLGYEVLIPEHKESGRSMLSKGMVQEAALLASFNINALAPLVSSDLPLVGIEPSAILTLRDEYKDLASAELRQQANHLAACTFTIEEFLYKEMKSGKIRQEQFTAQPAAVALHAHCYQKVLSSSEYSRYVLSFPTHYQVHEIPSGCCGMAGAFGYEKEHYDVSQQVAGLVLYPHLQQLVPGTIIAASGTSCRHQVKDGLHLEALHPVQVLFNALRPDG